MRLFNRGRYLSAQQEWEDAWRAAPAEERAFLEGLVQLAAALHLRTRRGATRGAVHLLSQALILLEDHRPRAHGIDVDPVGAWAVVLEEDQRLGEEMDGAACGAAARAEVERGGELDEALEKGAFLRGCRAPGVLPLL